VSKSIYTQRTISKKSLMRCSLCSAILTPNELVFTFEGSYVTYVPNLVKNSIKKCDHENAHRRTDTLTHWHSDENRFYNPSHATCYSYGTDNYRT